jgi:N6-L-threonylcarbamoyladenine synthase
MSLILAIETSCDETAVAILRGRGELLASEIASQIAIHQPAGGVVPEAASREHLRELPGLLEHALGVAGVTIPEIDAFAATSGPGLASSLMIGAAAAKGLALGLRKPYIGVNHLEGHLLSPYFGRAEGIVPGIGLIVSGGHTLLMDVDGFRRYERLGGTRDDAAGEAFDKVAKLLGLPYPGGPEIDRLARSGNPARFDFPRSMLHADGFEFSFSGLKTAVRYLLAKLDLAGSLCPAVGGPSRLPGTAPSLATGTVALQSGSDTSRAGPISFPSPSLNPEPGAGDDRQLLADLCASFQEAVVDVLVGKTLQAARATGRTRVAVSGGVSLNSRLRSRFEVACLAEGLELLLAPPMLCTDNAAMIASVAQHALDAGLSTPIGQDIDPNLRLTSTAASSSR